MATIKPLDGFAYLVDDPPAVDENGVVTVAGLHARHMDYVVAYGSGEGWGPGDRVLVDHPDAGRKVRIDGVACRVVPVDRIVATLE